MPASRSGSGDALFIRTGVWARRKAQGPWLRGRAEGGRSAGLDASVIPWLRQRDVALLGSDHPQYVSPGEAGGAPRGAVHDFALVYLGMPLFDNCDLEALADMAAAKKRWEFLLTASPLGDSRRNGLTSESNRDVLVFGLQSSVYGPAVRNCSPHGPGNFSSALQDCRPKTEDWSRGRC